MNVFTTPNLILAVGVLLLVGPALWRGALAWFATVTGGAPDRREFDRRTVADLLVLKERLGKYGHPTAEALCRDLIFAVINGDAPISH